MRPSPALVVAVIALFVALGGTSYAVSQLPRNSVGTAQLRDGAVTGEKISRAARRALEGDTGPQGRAGPKGAVGASGPAGTQGLAGAHGAIGPQGPSGSQGPAGAQGATGPEGPEGQEGPAGADGAPGPAIVARLRLDGGPITVQPGEEVEVPLTGSWTQAADEVDLVAVKATFTERPAICSGPETGYGAQGVVMSGQTVVVASFGALGVAENPDDGYNAGVGLNALAAPGVETVHSPAATLTNHCTGDGEDFTFTNLTLDIIAAR